MRAGAARCACGSAIVVTARANRLGDDPHRRHGDRRSRPLLQAAHWLHSLTDTKVLAGHAMFAGEKMILFYEHGVGTHLLRLSDIQHIEQCPHGKLFDGKQSDDKHDGCPDK
jgi:hypothetical protein